MNYEQEIIEEIINDLTSEIRSRQNHILLKIGHYFNDYEFTFQQFNGRFGGKNNTYVDSLRTQFLDFEDFYAQWIKGLIDKYEKDKENQIKNYGKTFENNASFINLKLIQDKEIESFVRLFLERNFYKKLNERTRLKPDEKFWSIWFGYQITYGLLIAPVMRKGEWTIDKSEIRKKNYEYWTIGHIMAEGFIDPKLNRPYKFESIESFLLFYQSVLKGFSKSIYEQKFFDNYVEYLKGSSDINSEPFLIPELRYAGLAREHIHRLDFTILNPYTFETIGFEISPSSSHMSVSNLKEKQYEVNNDLKKKWEKEMTKRNDYFKDYGITIITFTDSMLLDIDNCFETVIEKLKIRSKNKVNLRTQITRLEKIN